MTFKSDKFEKPAPKPLKESPPPPLPFAKYIKEEKKEGGKGKKETVQASIDESMQMLKHMKEMHEEINGMMNVVLEKTGWSPKYLKTYLQNTSNFNDADWESLQQQRQELMNSIKTPKDLRDEEVRAKKAPTLRENAPHDPKIAKERRSKTVGARRKWLPMR